MKKLSAIFIIVISILMFASCSSSKSVLSTGVDISKYQYVVFGSETTGDRDLDDIMMMVQNEIVNTKLNIVSSYNLSSAGMYVLTPHINVKSEKWDGGHTYITITFYDYYTNQAVLVVKSSGIGMTVSHDQDIALGAIRKELQKVFGKKE